MTTPSFTEYNGFAVAEVYDCYTAIDVFFISFLKYKARTVFYLREQNSTVMRLPVLFVLIVGVAQGQTTNNFIQTLATRNPQLQDTIFTTNVLFRTEVVSIASCAVGCLLERKCASFTFTPFSSSSSSSQKGLCGGYTTVLTADDASVFSPGSALFLWGNG